jgi:hypothetical protein
MAKVVNCWRLIAYAWDQSQVSPSLIFGAQSVTVTCFSLSTSVFSCQYHSNNCTYSLVLSLTLHECNLSHHVEEVQ